MGRWEPNAEGRIRDAALALFSERGYEATTVADIAAQAGLTGRTFFRYFADKREVLFNGSDRLQQIMVEALAGAPAGASAMKAVTTALLATGDFFGESRAFARQRRDIVLSTPELRERELIKFATLSSALAQALRKRGVKEPDASLAAEAGMAVFRVAYGAWVDAKEPQPFEDVVRKSLARLQALAAK